MPQGTVVVTGASTGIGEATVQHLAALGFDVLAGVRREEDGERLRTERIQPLLVDVTHQAEVADAAKEAAEASGGRLAGLVNNAGVAVSGPVEFIPLDELRRQLDINLVGQIAMTQAMLPLLRAARGRIVNISSIGGRVALPLVGPYAASKFALEGISDSLRRELRGQGVAVVLVEPGGVKTPIWDKGLETADDLLEDMPEDAERLYGGMIDTLRTESRKIATETGVPPSDVAEVIGRALTATRPKTRYLVGRDAKIRAAVAKRVPDKVMDAMIGRAFKD